MDIGTRYDPKKFEDAHYKMWLDNKYFHSELSSQKEPFTVILPPPNITGNLHMGHALNCVYQDIICRFYRMKGKNVLWIPGTDHAGIATQNAVEKELKKENIYKADIGKDKFINKVWEWKEKHGHHIIHQLKKIGASCDWDREKFTMDDELCKWVKKAFVHLYKKDLIYKGKYIVNHCPRCKTALADDEVNHTDNEGKLYYIKYYYADLSNKYEVIATTRPETILGDTGIAFYPSDSRYNTINSCLRVPIINRCIPLVPDHFVKPEFGTGLVKLTPAHDKNDFMAGQKNSLEIIKVIDEDGNICNTGTIYDGMNRFECREKIVADITRDNLMEKIEDYNNTLGHCYRCDTIIEPNLSNQWFVKMKPLAEKAIMMVKEKKVKVHPTYHEAIFYHWMENVTDWCISRQIWWGHQIPIYYCDDCNNVMCEEDSVTKCDKCFSNNIHQESDVLDTWFSSWLWPFSIFNEKELSCYYPTSFLTTGADILFFWVGRMMMAAGEFMNEIPFQNVYLHGIVRDEHGEKYSKGKGNGIDPLDIIDLHSADILRYTLALTTPFGSDIGISTKTFDLGKTFCTKFWNAIRYCLLNVSDKTTIDFNSYKHELDGIDKWIFNKLNQLIVKVDKSYTSYDFSEGTTKIQLFIWTHFCNTYLEIIKPRINDNEKKHHTSKVLVTILEALTRILHPTIPFLTEEIWKKLSTVIVEYSDTKSIMETNWVTNFDFEYSDEDDTSFQILTDIIHKIRTIKSEFHVDAKEYVLDIAISNLKNHMNYVNCNKTAIKQMTKYLNLYLYEDDMTNHKDYNNCLEYTILDNVILYVFPSIHLNIQSKIDILTNRICKVTLKLEKETNTLETCTNPRKTSKIEQKCINLKQELVEYEKNVKKFNKMIVSE